MRSITVSMSLCIALAMLFAAPASAEPQFIYGIHDFGANGVPVSYVDMETKGVKGWVVIAKEIGHNPNVPSDFDFRGLQKRGYTPICRLDNCYCCDVTCPNGWDGTLPPVQYYRGFAKCVQNFVRNSPGCHIWIIGNEPNVDKEWPGHTPGIDGSGEAITHDNYVTAYLLCWHAIKDMPEHAYDLVLPAAVCTWCAPYDGSYDGADPPNQRPNKGIEPFDEYFVNMLNDIVAASDISKISGIPIHVYTHGSDIDLITDGTTCETATNWPWYDDIFYHFQVYQNYMDLIPYSLNTKPVYITEAGQIEAEGVGTGWADQDNYETGYIETMYDEIDSWNSNNPTQKIRCVALYRWGAAQSEFDLAPNRDYVRTDWRAAMSTSSHKWTTTLQQDDAGQGLDGFANYPGAEILPFGGDYYGSYVKPTGDYNDFHQFYAYAGQTITVSASRPGTSTAPNVYINIYNPSSQLKGSSSTTTYGRLATYKADSTGWWYTCVATTSYTGDYLLGISLNDMSYAGGGGSYVTPASCTTYNGTDYQTGYECTKAYDGNQATSWRSTTTGIPGPGHWIAYDLGANYAVTMFKATFSSTVNYALRRFKIQSSETGGDPWTDEIYVDNALRDNSGTACYSYAYPKSLRYVRLLALDTGTANYAEVREFKVYANTQTMTTTAPTGARVIEGLWFVPEDSYYDINHVGGRAHNGSTADYWWSTNTAPPHYIWLDVGCIHNDSDPGSWHTVRGFIVKHAQVASFSSSYNTRDYKIQSAPFINGPWTDECSVTGNTASITNHSYQTPKQLSHVRLYITNPGTVDNAARIPEFEVWGLGPRTIENFDSSPPTFASTHDSMTAASWQTITGGPWGNYLRASRTDQGISTAVKTYTVPANTYVTVSAYIKCPPYAAGPYLAETAFKLGTNDAQDYYSNPWSWTVVERFCESGDNGSYSNGEWSFYHANVYTGSCTTISIGFKHAAFGSGITGPTVEWDRLRVD